MNKEKWLEKNQDKNVILFQEDNKIYKPSHMIKQVYSNALTTNQKKIYNFLVKELLKSSISVLDNNKIRVRRKDIEDFLQIKKYKELYIDLDKLIKTIITIEEPDLVARSGLISGYIMPKDKYDKEADNQHIQIEFNSKLTETFHKIERYIKMDIEELQALNNTHAITLYEIFKRQMNGHSTLCKLNLTTNELRKYLNISDKNYSSATDFNRYVIKKAIDEINKKTSISVEYKRVKLSKGVYQYNFSFSQIMDISLTQFIDTLKELAYYKSVNFVLDNKSYRFQAVNSYGDYARDISAKDTKILLIDTARDKIDTEKRNYFIHSETLEKEEALKIYNKLYKKYLKEKAFVFIYNFFIVKNLDKDNIKNISDIDEKFLDFVVEFASKFQ